MGEPTLVGDLRLDHELPGLVAGDHRRARLLVRLHEEPLGEVIVAIPPDGLSPARLAALVWSHLGDVIAKHLADDGLPAPQGVPVAGLADEPAARCRARTPGWEPAVTVVVPTRDRTASLLRCLDSLEELDYPRFDVIVVDSAPQTGETAEALRARAPGRHPVTYLCTPIPGGSLARNLALPRVTGEVVAFIDDDVRVDRQWLSAIVEGFADPAVLCVTGLILPAELDTAAQQWLEDYGGYARGFRARGFSLTDPPDDPLFPFTVGRLGSGANMAFRASWLRLRGGFDPAMGPGTPARGGEDLYAFFQVVSSGGRLVYQPKAIVRHWHRREYEGLRRVSLGYGMGLGAYLTAAVWHQPRLAAAMVRRTVPALRYLTSPTSAKNRGKGRDFPAELSRRERVGLLLGPFAYLASRRWARTVGATG